MALKPIWSLGNRCWSPCHQEHLCTAPCYFRETKAESTSKSRGRRTNGIIKEDKSMDKSFGLYKNLYLEIQVAQTNYPGLVFFYYTVCPSSSRFACALGFGFSEITRSCTKMFLMTRRSTTIPQTPYWLQCQIFI